MGYVKTLLYYKTQYSEYFEGTNIKVPIEKVQKELEKEGYKLTIEVRLANVKKGKVIIGAGIVHIEKVARGKSEKFDELKITENGEVYCDNIDIYAPVKVFQGAEWNWQLGKILNELKLIKYKTKEIGKEPVYGYVYNGYPGGGGNC